ncbi:MAG: hypothetical protein ACH344_05485 [Yersinia sp. (in: enterobacteria)]|jgi:secretion system chaperone SseA
MQINIEAEKKRIERECLRLQKYYSQFTELKQSIAELMNNAPKNSQAQSKLNELNSLFPDGIRGMERSVQQDMEALNMSLKKLKSQINQAVSNSTK